MKIRSVVQSSCGSERTQTEEILDPEQVRSGKEKIRLPLQGNVTRTNST